MIPLKCGLLSAQPQIPQVKIWQHIDYSMDDEKVIDF